MNVMPFGKYKGETRMAVWHHDPEYCRWLSQQDWFAERFPTLCRFFNTCDLLEEPPSVVDDG